MNRAQAIIKMINVANKILGMAETRIGVVPGVMIVTYQNRRTKTWFVYKIDSRLG